MPPPIWNLPNGGFILFWVAGLGGVKLGEPMFMYSMRRLRMCGTFLFFTGPPRITVTAAAIQLLAERLRPLPSRERRWADSFLLRGGSIQESFGFNLGKYFLHIFFCRAQQNL